MDIIQIGSSININATIKLEEVLAESNFGLEVIGPDGNRKIYKNADITLESFVSPSENADGTFNDGSFIIASLTFDTEGIYIIKIFKEIDSVAVEDLETLAIQCVDIQTTIEAII